MTVSSSDIVAFNAAWLKAWSAKDATLVAAFYTTDCVYMDPQVPLGVRGRPALIEYLTNLFKAMPSTEYRPDAVWATENGYCGRWLCSIGDPNAEPQLRGFDLVILRDGLIAHNEVFTHQLKAMS